MIFIATLFMKLCTIFFYLCLYFILYNKTNSTWTLKFNVKYKPSKARELLYEWLINIKVRKTFYSFPHLNTSKEQK